MRPTSLLILFTLVLNSPARAESNDDISLPCPSGAQRENGVCVANREWAGPSRALKDCNGLFNTAQGACRAHEKECSSASSQCHQKCQNLADQFPAVASSLNSFAFVCQNLRYNTPQPAPADQPVTAKVEAQDAREAPVVASAPPPDVARQPQAKTSAKSSAIRSSGSGFAQIDPEAEEREAAASETVGPALENYLPGGILAPRRPHAAANSVATGIHGPEVNLWDQISSRLEERCRLDRLYQCD